MLLSFCIRGEKATMRVVSPEEQNIHKLSQCVPLPLRQFAVASSLYSGDIDEMKHIVRVLSSRIEQILQSDSVFIGQSDVTVSSRVKVSRARRAGYLLFIACTHSLNKPHFVALFCCQCNMV